MKIDVPQDPMELSDARKWFLNYCKLIEDEEKRKKAILEDDSYILWLKKIILLNGFIDTNNIDTANLDDKENINDLRVLFRIIEEYANRKYISTYEDKRERYYLFNNRDIVYKIGYSLDNEEEYFCTIILGDVDNLNVLLFDEVKNEAKKIKEEKGLRNELIQLYSYLVSLKRLGVSDMDIMEVTGKALKLVNN